MLDFLERFGARAAELGWADLELFGTDYMLDVDAAMDACSPTEKVIIDPDSTEVWQR